MAKGDKNRIALYVDDPIINTRKQLLNEAIVNIAELSENNDYILDELNKLQTLINRKPLYLTAEIVEAALDNISAVNQSFEFKKEHKADDNYLIEQMLISNTSQILSKAFENLTQSPIVQKSSKTQTAEEKEALTKFNEPYVNKLNDYLKKFLEEYSISYQTIEQIESPHPVDKKDLTLEQNIPQAPNLNPDIFSTKTELNLKRKYTKDLDSGYLFPEKNLPNLKVIPIGNTKKIVLSLNDTINDLKTSMVNNNTSSIDHLLKIEQIINNKPLTNNLLLSTKEILDGINTRDYFGRETGRQTLETLDRLNENYLKGIGILLDVATNRIQDKIIKVKDNINRNELSNEELKKFDDTTDINSLNQLNKIYQKNLPTKHHSEERQENLSEYLAPRVSGDFGYNVNNRFTNQQQSDRLVKQLLSNNKTGATEQTLNNIEPKNNLLNTTIERKPQNISTTNPDNISTTNPDNISITNQEKITIPYNSKTNDVTLNNKIPTPPNLVQNTEWIANLLQNFINTTSKESETKTDLPREITKVEERQKQQVSQEWQTLINAYNSLLDPEQQLVIGSVISKMLTKGKTSFNDIKKFTTNFNQEVKKLPIEAQIIIASIPVPIFNTLNQHLIDAYKSSSNLPIALQKQSSQEIISSIQEQNKITPTSTRLAIENAQNITISPILQASVENKKNMTSSSSQTEDQIDNRPLNETVSTRDIGVQVNLQQPAETKHAINETSSKDTYITNVHNFRYKENKLSVSGTTNNKNYAELEDKERNLILDLVSISKNSTPKVAENALNLLKELTEVYGDKQVNDVIQYINQPEAPTNIRYLPITKDTNYENKVSEKRLTELVNTSFPPGKSENSKNKIDINKTLHNRFNRNGNYK